MIIPDDFDKSIPYYLAGPMTGYPNYNYDAFERVSDRLLRYEVSVYSPHTNPWPEPPLEGEALWRYMMKSALQLLLECDGIILLTGWERSTGASFEYRVAKKLKMPAYSLTTDPFGLELFIDQGGV